MEPGSLVLLSLCKDHRVRSVYMYCRFFSLLYGIFFLCGAQSTGSEIHYITFTFVIAENNKAVLKKEVVEPRFWNSLKPIFHCTDIPNISL